MLALTPGPGASGRRVDRVGAAGALLALAGCALPVAVFRANRIASGTSHHIGAAGPAGWLLVVACVAALAVAFDPSARRRAASELLAAGAAFAVLPWALATAGSRLLTGAPDVARASIGGGAWLVAGGVAVVAFAALSARPPGRARLAVGLAAAGSWAAALSFGGLSALSIAREYAAQGPAFWSAVTTHLAVVGAALAIALLVGVPLGVAASRVRWVRTLVIGAVGIIQTVPSLALLGLLVFPLAALGLPGIGTLPGIIALTLYALLPIVRNTYVGLAGVDPGIIDAGRGMGMGRWRLLTQVEAPLALPLLVEGMRQATVSIIGIAAVVAFVGVGTLGVLVFLGWGQQADDLILLGALPMVALAVLADAALRWLGRAVLSPGLKA